MLMFDSSRLYNPDKTQFSLTGGLKFIEAGRGCSRDGAGALSATSTTGFAFQFIYLTLIHTTHSWTNNVEYIPVFNARRKYVFPRELFQVM